MEVLLREVKLSNSVNKVMDNFKSRGSYENIK